MKHIQSARGSYILLVALDESVSIEVGRLGKALFPKGYYLYSGSALGGIAGRIKRHLRIEKKNHWHIDYLLKKAQIKEIWFTVSDDRLECIFAQTALDIPGAGIIIPYFGSSDCRCKTHLVYLPQRLTCKDFQKAIGGNIILDRLSIPDTH